MTGPTDGGPGRPGPLSGFRVIECGTLIAGPFCGQLLADFGAEVIKVEDPGAGDPMRSWGQVQVDGQSLHWPIIGRNKRSVTADLRSRDGQRLLRQLVGRADVLIENFRPGTLERWGLGWESLSADNPLLVLVRVSGYGQDGPYADRAGFGAIGEAMGGIRHLTGEPDRPPSRVGVSLGDSLTATFAAFGTVMALLARARTGTGQVVDAAIYESVLALMEATLPEWELAGYQRERSGAVLPRVAPSNAYPTRDGVSVLVAANRDTVFARLCAAMGRPALADDARFATHEARGDHQAPLDALIAEWTGQLDADAVLAALHEAGVPAGRVYRAEDMFADPHFAAREAIIRVDHPRLGPFPMPNVFPRLSGTPGGVERAAPELGADNEAVYRELLGLDDSELERLRRAGVI